MAQHQQQQQYQHHPAVDGLVSLFIKAHHDLSLVHLKLDKEFNQIYPDNANPLKLVARIKKIQDELPSLKDQCRELLTAKQELIDKASSILVGNRSMVQRMQSSVGIPVTSDSEDPAYCSFNQVIEEWTAHVRLGTGNEEDETAPEDINNLLFASIVRSN
uniref:Protein FAM33A n=1 Tax=Opuntia streptacantha TaxID=393608 RepID=A0A7C8YS46_OPUST